MTTARLKPGTDSLNFRSAPNASSEIIGYIQASDTVYLTGPEVQNENTVWIKGEFKGNPGWMAKRFLEIVVEPPAPEPVPPPPPAPEPLPPLPPPYEPVKPSNTGLFWGIGIVALAAIGAWLVWG